MARPPPHSTPSFASTTTKTASHTIPLSRRLLFPSLPPTVKDLPPLLVSPSASPELNAELYDFIALTLRAFVNPWWTKITRYDKELLPEITRVLAVLVRTLETRLISTDLSPLVFRDIPELIAQHYRDYRNASSKLSTSYAMGGAATIPQLFHNLQPHTAVSSDGRIDEVYVRQVVDHVLKTCLPPEDYEPEVERYIIREIVLKVLLQDVVPKITQPWFIQKTVLDLLGSPGDSLEPGKSLDSVTNSHTPIQHPSQFSFHSILVIFLSAVQVISGTCLALVHAYKQTLNTIKLVNFSQPSPPSTPSTTPTTTAATDTGSYLNRSASYSSSNSLLPYPSSPVSPPPAYHTLPSSSNYAYPILFMLAEILTTFDRFASNAIQSSVTMFAALFIPFIDRLFPYLLYTHVLSPASITHVVRIAKRTLFPNGYPSPASPDPTPEEQSAIHDALIRTVREKFPVFLSSLLLGPSPHNTIEAAVEPLSSVACNTHLIVFLLDAALLSMFPDIGVEGPSGGEVKKANISTESLNASLT